MKAKNKKEAFGLLLFHVLLILSVAQGRMLLSTEEEAPKVQYFEGGLVLRITSPSFRKTGTQRSSEPERILRSVPSPGVGH